jgi:hypothetical protein
MNAYARALWQVWRSGDGREGPGVKRAATAATARCTHIHRRGREGPGVKRAATAATTRCTHIHRRGREGPGVKRAPGGVARALLLGRCCGC